MVKLEKPWPGKKLAQTAEYISTRQKNALAKAEASYGLVQKADKRGLGPYGLLQKADRVFMQIFINRMVSGKTITLDVEASNAIKDVKAQICNFEGIPANQQRLIFNEQRLEKDRTLSDYHIQNMSTLHLLIFNDCCRGCEDKSPMDMTAYMRLREKCMFSSSLCLPNSRDKDAFNLCSKKLTTLLFWIFQVDNSRLDNPGYIPGRLWVNPGTLKSVACIREVLMDYFKSKAWNCLRLKAYNCAR